MADFINQQNESYMRGSSYFERSTDPNFFDKKKIRNCTKDRSKTQKAIDKHPWHRFLRWKNIHCIHQLTSFKGSVKWFDLVFRTSILDNFFSTFLGASRTIFRLVLERVALEVTPNALLEGANAAALVAIARAANWYFMVNILEYLCWEYTVCIVSSYRWWGELEALLVQSWTIIEYLRRGKWEVCEVVP